MSFLKSDFIKNSGVLFSSSGIAQLISLLIIPILSRIYSPAEHGIATLFVAIVSVCVAFSALRYEQAIVVEDDREKAKHLVYLSVLISLAWCIVFYAVLLLLQQPIYTLFKINGTGNWLYLAPFTVIISSGIDTLVMWFNRERKYKKLASNRVVGMASGSLYKLGHPYANLLKGNGLILGHFFSQVLQLLLLTPFRKINNLRVNTNTLKEVAVKYKSFALLATPSSLINIIGSYTSVFIISSLIGEEMTGFYGNAAKFTFIPMSAVSYAVGQVYFERLARLRDNDERHKLSLDLLKFSFYLAAVPVVVVLVFGDSIIPFILGNGWQASGIMAQITVVFFFAMYLTSPFSAAFEVYNKLNRQLWFTASFTIFTTLALYITYQYTNNIFTSLIVHAAIGTVIRLAMLFDCFRLIGSHIYLLVLKAILIVGGLTLLGMAIKFGVQ